ncbi:MAG: hypothetical protein M3362_00380 [Acidobacteriota bacterium]|nr:hypothetical protein [Acidobacteriota bacterium]
MSDTLLAAIVGAVAGIVTGSIGSLFAPWANWRIKQREQKVAYRRELISKWRKMCADIARDAGQDQQRAISLLQTHEDFYSLLPHHKHLPNLQTTKLMEVSGRSAAPVVVMLVSEAVAKIEQDWDLV